MTSVTRSWDRLSDHNPLIGFVDACLRGPAQVVLQNNPLTGLLVLVAIAWGAFENGQPRILGERSSVSSSAPPRRSPCGWTSPRCARDCSASAHC